MTVVACQLVLGKDAGISQQVISLSPYLPLVHPPLLLLLRLTFPSHFSFFRFQKLFKVDENFPSLTRRARARRYATLCPDDSHE